MMFSSNSARSLRPLTDEEIRWLHGDESATPAGIKHVANQIPEQYLDGSKTPDQDIPLARIGPGGDYTRDIHAGAVCAPRTKAGTPRRRGWLVRFLIFIGVE